MVRGAQARSPVAVGALAGRFFEWRCIIAAGSMFRAARREENEQRLQRGQIDSTLAELIPIG